MSSTVIRGQFSEPTPPARACGFCGEALSAIELWHSAENCSATRIAHANHLLEQGITAMIARVDHAMTRRYGHFGSGYGKAP